MADDSATRIVEALHSWITTAPPGARLPSTRTLTAEHGASPVTVQRALRQLSALGLVEARPGVGTFVRALRPTRPADLGWQTAALGAPPSGARVSATQRAAAPGALHLHSGHPARDLLPEGLVRAALQRAARSEAAVTVSPTAGLPELQGWFASQVAQHAPAGVTPPSARDVIVVPGSQSGLTSIFRSLAGPGRPLLVESPSYWGAILAANQAGVPMVPVPSGPGGPDPDEVERALVTSGARVFYAQPTFANPTGAQWSPRTREAVLEIVRRHGVFLVEDDWARDLAIEPAAPPLAAQDGDGHVIHLRSLTKAVSPAVRVAAVIARGPARDRLLADRAAESMYVSGLLQAAALDVVTRPAWSTHLRGLRQQLRSCRDLLLGSLRAEAPDVHVEHVPAGGLNLWARLPDGTDLARLVGACELRGLLVAAGDEWFPAEPTGPHLRLSFAGADPDRFPEAAAILGDTLRTLS